MTPVSNPYLTWLSSVLGAARTPRFGGGAAQAVMGYATGYGPAEVEIFVRSLRAHFDGRVVLFVDQDRPDLDELLAAHDVTAEALAWGDAWAPHPVTARFAAYETWLSERPWISDVLLTDVRDVVFQGDPFAEPVTGLEAFTEAEGDLLAAHAFNMKHLRSLAGEGMAQAVADKPCLCAGTILGPARAVTQLCRVLLMTAAIPRSGVASTFGTDQAAYNLAVHLGVVEAEVRSNFGRVATIGLSNADGLTISDDGLIVNPDGGISPVVHQYDRHVHLTAAVSAKWGRDDYSVTKARRKTFSDRRQRLVASIGRRLPEFR
ncbi:MAG: hypothetical protein KKG14_01300 [Alphaproteobacteria bacterium]|nr:hypothetical protein [Alphaproteobacteria bacterium]MBU2271892.1 hypothetical protein [Alphaproteobacteria bacterium]MBU2417324.1 hypothetical protein [Alphaproteobacteria bacterium]